MNPNRQAVVCQVVWWNGMRVWLCWWECDIENEKQSLG